MTRPEVASPAPLTLKNLNCGTEERWMNAVAFQLLEPEEIRPPHFGVRPDLGFKTFANPLAADFDSAIIICVADILQHIRHFGEGSPWSIFGPGVFPLIGGRAGARLILPKSKIRATKPGYKEKVAAGEK